MGCFDTNLCDRLYVDDETISLLLYTECPNLVVLSVSILTFLIYSP